MIVLILSILLIVLAFMLGFICAVLVFRRKKDKKKTAQAHKRTVNLEAKFHLDWK